MATYYVRSSGGNDGNDGLSFANGWATVQFAADTAVAGDVVLICADGTHAPSATVDFDTNAGANNNPITFRGAAADGTDDGTVATISGSGITTANIVNISGLADGALRFEGLRFTAATANGMDISLATNGFWISFTHCRFDSAAQDGLVLDTSYQAIRFYDCEFDNNGAFGIDGDNVHSNRHHFYRCSFHDNAGAGLELGSFFSARGSGAMLEQCLIYDNGSHGIAVLGASDYIYPVISGCTIFGNTGNGVDYASTAAAPVWIVDTILRSNGGYGIDTNGSNLSSVALMRNLCSHNNTSGHIDINSGTLLGSGHVLEDPSFTSETDGSENLTPANTNLKITSAFPAGGTTYAYIGAIEPNDAGGGGGGAIVNQGLHSIGSGIAA